MTLSLSCNAWRTQDLMTIPALKRLALIVEYDGTVFSGSQRQANTPTVQACLEEALSKLTGAEVLVSMAGRTDAGAHARGQVASFLTTSEMPPKAFIHGLNSYLPADIAVKSARFVGDGFDPRRQARARDYEYLILNRDSRSPLCQNRAYHVPGVIDVELMNQAASLLMGNHDLASFTCELGEGKSTVRHIFRAACTREGELVRFAISANAFLPHQVRITAGTLIRVGQRKLSVLDFKAILEACQPGLAGPTAPACGLYLNKVVYNTNEENNENV